MDWGIDRGFCVTVDNVTANNIALAYLKRKMKNWNGMGLNGEFLYMRCCAHILNLIMSKGLKEHNYSIHSICIDCRYIRSFPARQKGLFWLLRMKHSAPKVYFHWMFKLGGIPHT